MATLHQMAMKYADQNVTDNPQLTHIDKEQYLSYVDGASDALNAVKDILKSKYGYDRAFFMIDLLDAINELFKDEQKTI